MSFSFIFLNRCKKMSVNAKLKTSVSNQINSTELKCFNIETEQKAFYNLSKISLAIKENLNSSVFLLFTFLFSSLVNNAVILK